MLSIVLFEIYGPKGSPNPSNYELQYLQVTQENPVMGSAKASVTLFEFGDFQCPYCDQWFKTVEPQIVQNLVDPGTVKMVWRDFDYYGPDSTLASQAAYAAGAQGKFWQFYDLLYSKQGSPNSGWASKTNLESFAQSLNLNMTEFNQDFNSTMYTNLINTNYQDGQKLGVTGTPTFFLVGPTGQIVSLVGAQPYSSFVQTVDSLTSE